MGLAGTTASDLNPLGTDAPGVSNARRWAIVGMLFTASLINYFDRATVSFALPAISRELGLGPEAKGVLLSAFFWSYALMQIPIGLVADRLNLRWVYAGAFALWSVSQGLTGFAGSLAVLIFFRILLGIGESIYLPGGTKIVSILFSAAERGLPSGLFDFGTRTGLFLEGIIIPWMIIHYGWRKMFWLVGFWALLWLVPWLAVFPGRLPRRATAGAGLSTPEASTEKPRQTLQGLFALLRNRNLMGICLGFFCFDYYWYLLVTWLPDYLVTVRHFSLVSAGLSAAPIYMLFGVCEPFGGWLADFLIRRGWDATRTRKGIVTFAFLTSLLLIPAARVESRSAAVALILGAALVGLSTGNLLVILQSCAPPEEVGVWTGYENFAGNIAGIIAPLLTGFLISRTGSYFPGFALGPAILITGLLAYWLIVGELRPPTRREGAGAPSRSPA